METYLAHHGILGMKWGVRRYQNYDGTLTQKEFGGTGKPPSDTKKHLPAINRQKRVMMPVPWPKQSQFRKVAGKR